MQPIYQVFRTVQLIFLIEESRMLHSAFLERLYGATSKIKREHLETDNKVWSYVGRFITGFACVEYEVNQLCHELIGDSFVGNAFVTYTLDLRKKLDLVDVLLEERDRIEEWKNCSKSGYTNFTTLETYLRIGHFSDSFGHGIWCDYLNEKGELDFAKPGAKAKDNIIEYSELDSYDIDASDLCEKLERLREDVTSITEFSDDQRRRIEEAISSSENVIRFPNREVDWDHLFDRPVRCGTPYGDERTSKLVLCS